MRGKTAPAGREYCRVESCTPVFSGAVAIRYAAVDLRAPQTGRTICLRLPNSYRTTLVRLYSTSGPQFAIKAARSSPFGVSAAAAIPYSRLRPLAEHMVPPEFASRSAARWSKSHTTPGYRKYCAMQQLYAHPLGIRPFSSHASVWFLVILLLG